MTHYVMDASAVAPLLISDEAHLAQAVVERISDAPVCAPRHWPFEVSNMILMAARRGRLPSSELASTAASVERMGVLIDQQSERAAWHESLHLAQLYKLTLYDAAYLELAWRTGSSLLSYDRHLCEAATRAGIETPLI